MRALASINACMKRPFSRLEALAAAALVLLLVALAEREMPAQGPSGRPLLPPRRKQLEVARADTMRLWNGSHVRVFDAGICAGQELLPSTAPIASPSHQLSPQGNATLLKTLGSIDGWMAPHHPRIVESLTSKQWQLGIFGAVGEIGVHHGKFLLPIVGAADARETAVAIDLFEQQQGQNLDGSGSGSSSALVGNLQRAGLPAESVKLWAANSLDLTAGSFAAKQLPRFRMFSVDGSHRVEATLRDLQLASCVLMEGGVVVVDDFVNQGWIGVAEAVFLYINHDEAKLVPFMMIASKLYLTTKSHHKILLDAVKSDPNNKCETRGHVSARSIGGWEYCYVGADVTGWH